MAYDEALAPYEREHVTPFIWQQPERFPALELDYRPDRRHWRLTVDTQNDYDLAKVIYERLYASNPSFGFSALEKLFADEPRLLKINRNEARENTVDIAGVKR